MSKLETTIPPWALPGEDIPIHVKLNKQLKYSKIIIEIPECFEIKEKINVLESRESNNRIEIYTIGKARRTEKDYFGIVIATKHPFEELAVKSRIKIKLICDNQKEEEFEIFARIFRPLLEIDKVPDEIPINDTYEPSLPIHLKFTGFGDIKLRLECSIGGQIVSEGDSVLDEIFRRMVREGLVKENNFENKLGVQIDKKYVQKVISDFREKFRNSDQLQQMLTDRSMSKELITFLLELNESEQEKFMGVFYNTIEGYLIKIITDILNRNISNNLHLDSGTKILTEIKIPITNVKLKISYSDVIGNEYAPLERTFKIHDKRKNSSKIKVEIPIEIEHVDDKNAYKNVQEMKIGSII